MEILISNRQHIGLKEDYRLIYANINNNDELWKETTFFGLPPKLLILGILKDLI